MADQPIGADQPYLAPNNEGVGAVFFDRPSKDLLSIHLSNLEGVDKALGEKKEQQKQARAVATKLLEYKNPDTNGIFPKDSEEINKKGQEVTQTMTDLLRIKQDPSNPEWVSAYNSLNNKKQELLTLIGASKAFNKDITSVGGQFAKGELKNADPVFWAQEHEKALKMTAAERAANGVSPTNWIRPLTPKLDDMLSAHISKNFKEYQEPKTSPVEISKGTYGQKIHKTNLTPEQTDAMASSYLSGGFQNSKEAVDEAFANQPQEVADKYIGAAKASGIANDIVANEEAKKQWLKDHIAANYVKEQNSYKFDGITPQERAKWKISEGQAKEIAKGGWVWTMAKGSIDPNSDVSTPQPYTTSNGTTISLKGNPALNAIPPQQVSVPIYKLDENGNIVKVNGKPVQASGMNGEALFKNIPNHILANGYDANGNWVLVTSESKYYGDATGDTKQELQVVKPDQAFDYIKSRVAGAKYAQGATDLANAEGYRDAKTGKIEFKSNPNLRAEVQSPMVTSRVPAANTQQKQTPAKKEEAKIRVRRKSDGKTGTIDDKDFNESKYEKL